MWVAGRPTEFNLYTTLRVPYDQDVLYRPGVLETVRYALLQYFVVYLLVAALITTGVKYMFQYNVFETVVREDPTLKHLHQD